jgi:hypothetical protein
MHRKEKKGGGRGGRPISLLKREAEEEGGRCLHTNREKVRH